VQTCNSFNNLAIASDSGSAPLESFVQASAATPFHRPLYVSSALPVMVATASLGGLQGSCPLAGRSTRRRVGSVRVRAQLWTPDQSSQRPKGWDRPWIQANSQPMVAPRTAEMQGDPFGLLLRQRTVFLGGEVEDFGADAIISQLLLLDSQDPTKDIKMFINSPGAQFIVLRNGIRRRTPRRHSLYSMLSGQHILLSLEICSGYSGPQVDPSRRVWASTMR
jgi:hypothetical protein